MASGGICISLRSRGLVILNPYRDSSLRHQAKSAFNEILNISCAILYNVVLLSWSAWFSVLVNLMSAIFFFYYEDGKMRSDASLMLPFCFLVYLPVLWMIHAAYSRRNDAQDALNKVKSLLMGMHTLCSTILPDQATDKLEELDGSIVLLLDDLQEYLQHPGNNAKQFDLSALSHDPVKSRRLAQLSQQLGVLQRRVHRGIKDLYTICHSLLALGVSEQQVSVLTGLVIQLQQAIEALSGFKELRTPVMLRAAMCSFSTVVVPLFFGAFVMTPQAAAMPTLDIEPVKDAVGAFTATANVNSDRSPDKLVYGMVLGVMLQVMLMTLLNLATSLEDPFDPTTPDVLSFAETRDQILYMISPDDDDDAGDALGGTLDQDAAAAGVYLAAAGKGGMAGVEGAGDGGVMLSMPPMPHLT